MSSSSTVTETHLDQFDEMLENTLAFEQNVGSSTGTISRRMSVRQDGPLNETLAPLSNNTNSIIQNVPESLPTTPGYEIDDKMFAKGFSLHQPQVDNFPTQRPGFTRSESRPILERWRSINDVFSKLIPKKIQEEEEVNTSSTNVEEHSPVTDATEEMTFRNPPKNLWRFISCCIWCFNVGLSDGAPGALLPYMEEYYNISYSVVSLIWMSTAVGFIVVALLAHKIEPYLNKELSLGVGSCSLMISYIFISTGSKFPLIVVGFFFCGVGVAINISQMNIFLSRLEKASTALGLFHGSYGLGATLAPLIATQFVNSGIKWHMYYIMLVGLMFFNATNIFLAFKGANADLAPWDNKEDSKPEDMETPLNEAMKQEENMIGLRDLTREGGQVDLRPNSPERSDSTEKAIPDPAQAPVFPKGNMSLALHNRVTWLLSLFVLFYQGAEVSMGGWVVTFLLTYRNDTSSSVGYVASGYWFGLTLGRLFLTRLFHKYLGARRAIIISAVLSIVFIALTWLVPNVIAAGVFVSLAGVFVGPTYPLMITIAAKVLPRKIQVVSLTIMTAFGSSGGALFPFLVGLISQFTGTFVVHPIFIALYSLMLFVWVCLPNIERKTPHMNIFQRFW
ncbi:hypothetical protein CLIB1423_09S00540 [[Candida] railenensis]|uniref:Major facilitator superfamily (MFS) profile domain-containing protein n=1 Tax=[Candida] railenensis TaxID=45579 RepID=A0A9P0QPD6_9ASCO|nr:hypothetical protein CLIB1423_09S00540 [[Candida] railenensis]